jgi:hypothetical protein
MYEVKQFLSMNVFQMGIMAFIPNTKETEPQTEKVMP